MEYPNLGLEEGCRENIANSVAVLSVLTDLLPLLSKIKSRQ